MQARGGMSVYFRELINHLIFRGAPFWLSLFEPLRQNMSDVYQNVASVDAKFLRALERHRSDRLICRALGISFQLLLAAVSARRA
jgi:hypothetical protein